MKKLFLLLIGLLFCSPLKAESIDADKMLYLGIIENNPAYVDQAIINGAYLNRRYDDDYTPLMIACALNSQPAILKSLINAGADMRVQNSQKQTLLTAALNNKSSPENIRLLTNYGLNPNEQDDEGHTPLYTALINKAPLQVISTLINVGANPDLPFNFKGNEIYPLTMAVILKQDRDIKTLLIRHSNQDAQFQALMAAVANNDKETHKLFQELNIIK